MNTKITLIGLPLLLASVALQANDITEVHEPEMEQSREQLRVGTQSMSGDDPVRHQQFNRNDEGKGNMYREGDGSGDGSGDQYRDRDRSGQDAGQYIGSSYGSGYSYRHGDGVDSGNGQGSGSGNGPGNGSGNGSGKGGGQGGHR